MHASKEELVASLKGAITNHHRFMLRTIKESIQDKEKTIKKLATHIEEHVKANEHTLDAELLSTIPGVGKDSLVVRRGKKRALIAVGRKILIAAYFILRDQQEYKELGGDFLEKRNKDKKIKRYLKKLKELGVEVDTQEEAA